VKEEEEEEGGGGGEEGGEAFTIITIDSDRDIIDEEIL
jgi:hypothetical protein